MTSGDEAIQRNREIAEVVNGVLRERLGRFGFENADVHEGYDSDGDRVLFIDAHYRRSNEPIDPKATFELLSDLRAKLESVGEARFPHVRHLVPEGQRVAGWS